MHSRCKQSVQRRTPSNKIFHVTTVILYFIFNYAVRKTHNLSLCKVLTIPLNDNIHLCQNQSIQIDLAQNSIYFFLHITPI